MNESNAHGFHKHVVLKKTSTQAQMWALAVGAMVGWGCFIIPEILLLPTSGPLGAFLGMALGALMICLVALCCGTLIKVYPVAGGAFSYAYVGLGSTIAFIAGWCLVLMYVSAVAANGTALLLLVRFLCPGVFDFVHLYTVYGWDIYLGEVLFVMTILAFFTYSNYKGMNFASQIQLSLSLALVAGTIALICGAFTVEGASFSNLQPYFAENKSIVLMCQLNCRQIQYDF